MVGETSSILLKILNVFVQYGIVWIYLYKKKIIPLMHIFLPDQQLLYLVSIFKMLLYEKQ